MCLLAPPFQFINARLRWLSLLTVMAGVSLVGFSGSLIKDTLQPIAPSLANLLDSIPATGPPANEPIDNPEATKVVIGICFSVLLVVSLLTLPASVSAQVSFLSYLRKFCE